MTTTASSLDEALEALKRDPTQPVRAKVGDLTIELRAVEPEPSARTPGESAADAFREIGAWEGETLVELLAFFTESRRRGSRSVPEL